MKKIKTGATALLIMLLVLAACSDDSSIEKKLGKSYVEKPYREKAAAILHVSGSPYDMGFQQGYHLSEGMEEVFSRVCTYTAYQYNALKTGSSEPPGRERLAVIHDYMKKRAKAIFGDAIHREAPDLEKEMQGMAAGLAAKGSKLSMDDILLMNVIPDVTNNRLFFLKFLELDTNTIPGQKKMIQCSGMAAWGTATRYGRLLHGANLDFNTFGVLEKHVTVMVAKPEKGNSFAGVIFPGLFIMTGMNDKGLSINDMTSESSDSDLLLHPQVPHTLRLRMILQQAADIEDAEDIVRRLGGGIGWNILVSEGRTGKAVDIECSANHYGIVRPWDDPETASVDESLAICVTNQSMACPGFRGYSGENMTAFQLEHDGIDTSVWGTGESYLASWLSLMDVNDYGRLESVDRWSRLWSLFTEKTGDITKDDMISFMGDTQTGPHGGTISDASEVFTVTPGPVPHVFGPDRQITDQAVSAIYSCVFEPGAGKLGTAWIAAGEVPAQMGKYICIDLERHLERLK